VGGEVEDHRAEDVDHLAKDKEVMDKDHRDKDKVREVMGRDQQVDKVVMDWVEVEVVLVV